ncbi:MAG: Calx-beta domain-containing protein [Pyrinomonadaceae bacterium]
MILALNNFPHLVLGRSLRGQTKLLTAAVATLVVFGALAAARSYLSVAPAPDRQTTFQRARLSERASLRAAGRGASGLSLRDGHELLSAYKGPAELQRALAQNEAHARSLASADFDEDGVSDLAGGYAYGNGGIVTVHRGNADSIYANAPEAQARKANGTFTAAPFLSPALAIEIATPADFLGAGDFDADGHWDIVSASRGSESLWFLAGDGKGNFGAGREVSLGGHLTAFETGEINRRDGLTDIVVGVVGPRGNEALVFEGSEGALKSKPEAFDLPASATSFALGQFGEHYAFDLAIAAGNELVLVEGRDRKLSLSGKERAEVSTAQRSSRAFDFTLRSIAAGNFGGDLREDLALLAEDGDLHFLNQTAMRSGGKTSARPLRKWPLESGPDYSWPGATQLLCARVTSAAWDDLVVLDTSGRQLQVISRGSNNKNETQKGLEAATLPALGITSLAVDGEPLAALPMRLDVDGLSDLVVLQSGSAAATVVPATLQSKAVTQGTNMAEAVGVFSNPTTININNTPPTPVKATPYPSTITIAGQTGTINKLRVRLNNFYHSSTQNVDVLLVGPTGQTTILMSDVMGSVGSLSPLLLTFDDQAASFLGAPIVSGSYKPTDVSSSPADSFPSPAPAGPYVATLAGFAGTNPNGNWDLYIVDDAGIFGPGAINGGWSLIIDDPPPLTFVVINTNDSGPGSLRQAILDANFNPGADIISFSIPGSGPHTITPASALPDITDVVTIDGTTQPGFQGAPVIEIDGTNTGPFAGTMKGLLNLKAGNSVVRGLVINRYNTDAIALLNVGNNIIEGNFIGTDVTGTLDRGNQLTDGIAIDTPNNLIGGTTTAARNLISGVAQAVVIAGPGQNLVQGNLIGTNINGNAPLRNSHTGVTTRSVPGSPNNVVGGTVAGARNIISRSGSAVDFVYSGSQGNLVQGNFIGTDLTGTVSLTDITGTGNGVVVSFTATNNTIGGTTPAARNVISGNLIGAEVTEESSTGNLLQGNFIGTDVNGTAKLANQTGVFLLFSAVANTIGGAVDGARNIISGNTIYGIQVGQVNRTTTFSNLIQGNYIGTDVSGNNPLGNGRSAFFDDAGIVIPANATGDRIVGNRIAYNKGHGIRITNVSGSDSPGIRIEIVENLIYANEGLGIDLGNSGITPNDPLDADDGPNLLQNFPQLTSFTGSVASGLEASIKGATHDGIDAPGGKPVSAEAVTVNGTLNSAPNTAFTVHWYFSGDSQCVTNQASSRPLATGRIPSVTTDASGNAPFAFPFDFPTGINSGIINCTATDPQGNTSEFSACLPVSQPISLPVIQFSTSSFSKSESGPSTNITVTRTGDTAGASAVNFSTGNNSYVPCNQINGTAVQNCDFILSSGTLNFAAGQASRTFPIIILEDLYVEGDETIGLTLSSPSGAVLGPLSAATLTLVDNDSGTPTTNPLDDPQFYVRQHYYDFLGRPPDDGGLAFWTNEITQCGTNQACINERRVAVSNAFFFEQEYQQTASYVFLLYRAAYGNDQPFPNPDFFDPNVSAALKVEAKKLPRYLSFVRDRAQVVGGSNLAQTQLALANAFVQRQEFKDKYPPLSLITGQQFVDAVLATIQGASGVTLASADRNALITHHTNGERGLVMFHLANDYWNGCHRLSPPLTAPCVPAGFGTAVDNRPFIDAEYNRSFVASQYFGYLRRDGDIGGFMFWLTEVSKSPPRNVPRQRAMVCSFMTSTEYQHRLSPVATHNNSECPPPP